jgi:hypothetical protein
MTGATEMNDDIFADISEQVIEVVEAVEVKEVTIDIPEALQVCKMDSNNRREIVDTYKCNKQHGIIPISKAKSKAECLKRIFPKNTYVVVAIIHKVNKFGKVERVFNVLHTY